MRIETLKIKNFKVFRDVEIKNIPNFLNAIDLSELYCLVKEDGYTKIYRAIDSPLVASLYRAGDLLGYLWNQELLLEEVAKQ